MGNLFSDIYKYKQSEEKSSLENYCTEIFAYIFRQLLKSKDDISYRLLEMFGFSNIEENDLKYIEIITQESHKAKDKTVIPDIIIKSRDKINIIEVKIDSGLRYYKKSKTKYIDQIEQYQNITDIKKNKKNEVFLLSKYIMTNNSLESTHKILWSQIYSLLTKKTDNEIINKFVEFLEENGMKSFIINDEAENAIDSIAAILNLIEKTWNNTDISKKYPLKKNEDVSRHHIGFYVKDEKTAWIGQLEKMKEYLVFQIFEKLDKKAESIFSKKDKTMDQVNDHYIFAKIPIKDISSKRTEKEQQEVFQKWINEEINKILL